MAKCIYYLLGISSFFFCSPRKWFTTKQSLLRNFKWKQVELSFWFPIGTFPNKCNSTTLITIQSNLVCLVCWCDCCIWYFQNRFNSNCIQSMCWRGPLIKECKLYNHFEHFRLLCFWIYSIGIACSCLNSCISEIMTDLFFPIKI